MQLIRIAFEYTHHYHDADGDFLYKEVKQRVIQVVVGNDYGTKEAEFFCDNYGGNAHDPAYKRLHTSVDKDDIAAILPSPQYRI